MSEAIVNPATNGNAEAVPLVCDMARTLRETVAGFEKHWNLSRAEAIDRTNENETLRLELLRTAPPDQLSWSDLYILSKHSPELAAQRWKEVNEAARNELRTGHRAASCVVPKSTSLCWYKARFLALREELLEGLQPRNSVERLLVDTLAQAQSQYERWLEELNTRTTLQAVSEGREEGRWNVPRLTDSEAIEQAAAMVDRFQKIVMRTIRELHRLRRNPPVVMVKKARQVNVGQQQVNGVSRR
jgi:hypothetical protein